MTVLGSGKERRLLAIPFEYSLMYHNLEMNYNVISFLFIMGPSRLHLAHLLDCTHTPHMRLKRCARCVTGSIC